MKAFCKPMSEAQKQIQITQMKEKLLKSSISNIRKLTNKQQTLSDENKSLHGQIFGQIRKFEQEIQIGKQKIRKQLKMYRISLQDDAEQADSQQRQKAKKQLIDIKELGKYLQQQKLFMKNLVAEQKMQEEQTTDKLHSLLNKKRLEQTLLNIKKKQLEQQIKFIETNVLLSSGISYDIKAPLQHEQQELKGQIARKIEELERVIGLSISCEGAVTGDQGQKMKIIELQKQHKRLQTIQRLLKQQNKKLNAFQSFLKDYPMKVKQIPNPVIGHPQQNYKAKDSCSKWHDFRHIESSQIQQLVNLKIESVQGDLTVTLNQDSQIQQKINDLRKKIRKIQGWVR